MQVILVEHWHIWVIIYNFFVNIKAPEVYEHKNYSYTVDYFALGVLTYELMTGYVFYFLLEAF